MLGPLALFVSKEAKMDDPLMVEIIAYAPTAFYHCTHCEVAWREMGKSDRVHEEQLESSLPEDLQREYAAISDWVKEMFRTHCDRLVMKVIDAASVEGVYKSLRYNARRYPAIIVNRRGRFIGTDALTRAADEIGRLLNEKNSAAKPA